MAVPGQEPKPGSINRNTSTVDWTDVPDIPYTGVRPKLPKARTVLIDDDPVLITLDPLTVEWWSIVSTMPHASLWAPSDWLLATSTALLFDIFVTGKHTVASELRRREQELGMTPEARRKLRIRYTPVEKPAPKPRASRAKVKPNPVVQIDDRRKRSTDRT